MFQHVVVPVDDSEAAWRAVPIAARMAADVCGVPTVFWEAAGYFWAPCKAP